MDKTPAELSFIERFGEHNAAVMINAAVSHMNAVHDDDAGELFLWALAICIGSECMKEKYRTDHPFENLTEDEVRAWCLESNWLGDYEGDVDYLALMIGMYHPWVIDPETQQPREFQTREA